MLSASCCTIKWNNCCNIPFEVANRGPKDENEAAGGTSKFCEYWQILIFVILVRIDVEIVGCVRFGLTDKAIKN